MALIDQIPIGKMPVDYFAELTKGMNDILNKNRQAQLNAQLYGMLRPSGDVANAIYTEGLKTQYGEEDPRYIEAKRAQDATINSKKSLIDYREMLNNTAGVRYSSPLGKLIQEGKGRGAADIIDIMKHRNDAYGMNAPTNARYLKGNTYYDDYGDVVGDTNPRTPEERQAYEQAIAKQTTDAEIRNKIPFAENVETTMDSIIPEDLLAYSGPKGSIELAKDMLRQSRGKPSEKFLKYSASVASASALSKQLRQFWGDSIQPAAIDRIDKLTNPSTWWKNPEVAKKQFDQLKEITRKELRSFTAHGTSPIKLGFKNGVFITNEQKSAAQEEALGNNLANPDMDFAKYASEKLVDILPDATPEAIMQTHQATGKSVHEIVDHLVKVAKQKRKQAGK